MHQEITKMLTSMKHFPEELRKTVASLPSEKLDQPIRHGAWTIRQIIHHLPDSHMNSYIRIKMILTEEKPNLKPYNEVKWAELIDYQDDIYHSIDLLDIIHYRILQVLRDIKDEEWMREGVHDALGPVH